MDKPAWGPGPWQEEPDELHWVDEATLLPCLISRSGVTGALNGYVGVTPDHRLFGRRYNDKIHIANVFAGIPLDSLLSVHGGLTYSGEMADDPAGLWFLGFDCAHCDDFAPGLAVRIGRPYAHFGGAYRDIAFVMDECAQLAKQIRFLDCQMR